MKNHIIGVDVGGTFTDLIVTDTAGGEPRIAKVPSTLDNQAFGVLAAIEQTGVSLSDVDVVVHGTTTTTNALYWNESFRKSASLRPRDFAMSSNSGGARAPMPMASKVRSNRLFPASFVSRLRNEWTRKARSIAPLKKTM